VILSEADGKNINVGNEDEESTINLSDIDAYIFMYSGTGFC
jgi:hypothetical protein